MIDRFIYAIILWYASRKEREGKCMDFVKIGQFIVAKRKEKNLTQKELARQLYLGEKTISK